MKSRILIRTILVVALAIITIAPAYSGNDYDDYIVSNLLNSNDCPLLLTHWHSWYRTDDTITFGDAFLAGYTDTAPRVREAGFQYEITLSHVGSVDIVAFQVNVVVFNAFNEYLDTFGIFQGAVLTTGKEIGRKNMAMFNGDSTAFTYFLWVDKVRDVDGNLYFADVEGIRTQISEAMGFDFPLEFLEAGTVLEGNTVNRFREREYVDVYDRDN